MWAGRDFHQRPQQGLNDYFWMSHDGQGGGFKNLNLGGAKFDFGFVGQVDNGDGGALVWARRRSISTPTMVLPPMKRRQQNKEKPLGKWARWWILVAAIS